MRFDAVRNFLAGVQRNHTVHRAGAVRFDAGDLALFAETELRQVITQTYDRRYPEYTAKQHIPTGDHGVNRAAMSFAFRSWDFRGEARILGANVNDIPRVAAQKSLENYPVRTIWDAYAYTIEQFEAAQFAGIPLETQLAFAAKRAIEQKQNEVLYYGSPVDMIPGLLTNPTIPIITVPNGAWLTNGSITAEMMVADLMAVSDQIWIASNQVFRPDTIGLPLQHFRKLATVNMVNTATSAFKYFLENNGFVNEIVPIVELATAGPSGAPRMVAYQKSIENLAGIEPLPFTQEDPQVHGMETVVPCRARTAGTIVFWPGSIAFGDGI